MSGTVPPIPPPFGANTANPSSPIRTGNPTDTINNPTTTNVVPIVNENLPQLLDSRGGSHVTNVPEFDEEDFSSWKDRLKFNAFKELKGEKVNGTFTRLKSLLNDLENNGVSIPQAEVNATFVNSLPKKWLSMNQTHRVNNSIKNDTLATLYGKYNYEEGLIDQIYESELTRFTLQGSKALISNPSMQESNSDIKEDQRSSSEFLVDLNAEFHERAFLSNQRRFFKRGKSEKGLVAELFNWDEESVSSDDEGVTTFKALMAVDDEPSVGRVDARSGQWVEITMNKRKNLLNNYNSLLKEFSLCKSELSNLKNTKALNSSFQNEITKLSLENESLKDEISNLKKVNEKWTTSRVTLDQLLTEQVPGHIVMALGGTGKKKEKGSLKEIVFTKSDVSTSETNPELPSDLKTYDNSQRPLPSLPKLIGAKPSIVTKCLTIPKPKQPTNKVVPLTVKHRTETTPTPTPNSSTKKLLLTLMKECEFYPGCDLCGSIAHETSDCPKKTSQRKPRIALKQSSKPTAKYLKESGPKVVFGDNSSGDTEGYGLANCNAKRRNITLIEAARTMLNNANLLKQFLGEAVNTARYTQNRSIIVKRHGKTAYDVFRRRSLDISYFHVFGCPVHIHNHRDHLGKFDEKADDGFFLGYSLVAKAFRVFNIRRQEMEETFHVTFSEDDEAVSQISTEGDVINFNEIRSFPDDEF
ncbi:retrovirus-related pol polyprotein from transposon TNT 1-94 [Tanacetum coccineum]